MSECVLKTLACRGLRVGPSKVHSRHCVGGSETARSAIIKAEQRKRKAEISAKTQNDEETCAPAHRFRCPIRWVLVD